METVQFKDIERLLQFTHSAVCTTHRKDGAPQMSVVTVGSFEGGLAFTTRRKTAKANNLIRDPRCALMVVTTDFRSYAVIEGEAEVRTQESIPAKKLLGDLRGIYKSARGGIDHEDWEEYDRVMLEEERIGVILRPGRMVGIRLP